MGGVVVAESRKRTGRPKGPEPRRKTIASLKTSSEYADWFEALLDHFREKTGVTTFSASALIEMAISDLAKREGIESSPRR